MLITKDKEQIEQEFYQRCLQHIQYYDESVQLNCFKRIEKFLLSCKKFVKKVNSTTDFYTFIARHFEEIKDQFFVKDSKIEFGGGGYLQNYISNNCTRRINSMGVVVKPVSLDKQYLFDTLYTIPVCINILLGNNKSNSQIVLEFLQKYLLTLFTRDGWEEKKITEDGILMKKVHNNCVVETDLGLLYDKCYWYAFLGTTIECL